MNKEPNQCVYNKLIINFAQPKIIITKLTMEYFKLINTFACHQVLESVYMVLRKLAHAIYRKFSKFKNRKFSVALFRYFSYFCSKHRLWVHVRTASTSTHNLCFGAKIRK